MSIMRKIKLFILLTLGFSTIYGQAPIDYIRTSEYGRLKISLTNFKKIVSSVQYYYKEVEKDTTDVNSPMLKCDISRKALALTLSTFKQISDLNLDNENYTDVLLIYAWKDKNISEVTLWLNGSYKKLTVRGKDEKKVEALYRDIDSQIRSSESFMSWLNLEMAIGMLSTVLFVISVLDLLPLIEVFISKRRNLRSSIVLCLVIIYLLAGIIFFFSPVSMKDFFPNFLLTANDLSWIDRNANMLGFIGFLITIVSILYSTIKWFASLKK